MEPSHGLSNITYGVRQGESETSPAPRTKWVWHSVARGAILSAPIRAQGSRRPLQTGASKPGQGSSKNDSSDSLLSARGTLYALVLSNRTSCSDGNVLYLHCPIR